jgi:hypothetical protein
LGPQAFGPGYRYIHYLLPGKVTYGPVSWLKQAVFSMGLALRVFAAVRQVATASSMWCIAEDNACNHVYFMCPNNQRRWYMLLLPWWWIGAYQKSRYKVSALRRGAIWGQQKTPIHPSPIEWFWEMRVLFPVLRYIWCEYRYT